MPLDWLSTPIDPGSVAALIVRKRRAKAIETMRSRALTESPPTVKTRMQLIDLMIESGRQAEAVPILHGLADEFTADGFLAKAIAILKRIDRIEPGRTDVAEKLQALVSRQVQIAQAAPNRPAAPSFGMEEMTSPGLKPAVAFSEDDSGAMPSDPSNEGELPGAQEDLLSAPAPADGDEPQGVTTPAKLAPEEIARIAILSDLDAAGVLGEALPAEPVEVLDADVEEKTVPPAPDGASVSAAEGPSLSLRIRGAFRRFLSSLPGTQGEAVEEQTLPPAPDALVMVSETVAPASDSAPSSDASAGAVESIDLGAPIETLPEVEPIADSVEDEVAVVAEPLGEEVEASTGDDTAPDPLAELTADVAPGEVALSDDAFFDQMLDLVTDVLKRPVPASATAPALATEEWTARALATPLLGELTEAELLAVVQGMTLRQFAPGEILVTEGEPGQSLFIITSGRARVFVRNPSGHDVEVGRLAEGEFFGEISALSGKPRTATITAAAECEALELDKSVLNDIARAHPGVRDKLDAAYIARASSPESAAVRVVKIGDRAHAQRAIEVLEAYFGESRWNPRMRLRLARVLMDSGKHDEAVPILIGLADELAHSGFPEKAIAVIKKIEQIQSRHVKELPLAPLLSAEPVSEAAAGAALDARLSSAVAAGAEDEVDDSFQHWLVRVVREAADRQIALQPAPIEANSALESYGPGLSANPLFAGFNEDELCGLIQRLRLLSFDSGDIIMTEGEPGEGVYILAAGRVNVFARKARGHNDKICSLEEGSFFGEMAALTGRPRSATIVAAARCELLELDHDALADLLAKHPRTREILEQHFIERAERLGLDARIEPQEAR